MARHKDEWPALGQQEQSAAEVWWTLGELAARLGIRDASLRQRIARGTMRASKRGRDWFVDGAEADRIIAEVAQRRAPV